MPGSEAGEIRVIGILGPSYCGSTVISYLLNTDPETFGGSELRRLVEQPDKVACSLCREACPYWTRENIDRFRKGRPGGGTDHFYAKVASITGKRLIADSSKSDRFFSEAFISQQERQDGVRFAFLIPVKHPVRFYASYVYNDYFRRRGRRVSDYDEVRDALAGPEREEVLGTFLPRTARMLLARYRALYRRFAYRDGRPCFLVKHEDLADDRGQEGLETVVEQSLGHRPKLDTEAFQSYEAHPIGGNRGPYWQVRLDRRKGFAVRDPRFRYYRARQGVLLDQKFAHVLPRDMIDRVLEWKSTRQLARLLAYSDEELMAVRHEPG